MRRQRIWIRPIVQRLSVNFGTKLWTEQVIGSSFSNSELNEPNRFFLVADSWFFDWWTIFIFPKFAPSPNRTMNHSAVWWRPRYQPQRTSVYVPRFPALLAVGERTLHPEKPLKSPKEHPRTTGTMRNAKRLEALWPIRPNDGGPDINSDISFIIMIKFNLLLFVAKMSQKNLFSRQNHGFRNPY